MEQIARGGQIGQIGRKRRRGSGGRVLQTEGDLKAREQSGQQTKNVPYVRVERGKMK